MGLNFNWTDDLSDSKYHAILVELGILDDLEDWELFKKQESKFSENLEYLGLYLKGERND